MATRNPHLIAARIVQEAGGELIGRTRLQKVTYLAELAGFGNDFAFRYHNYGPYSEDLARGMEIAVAFGGVREEEKQAGWGGWYSIYRTPEPRAAPDGARARFIRRAAEISPIALELAATAAFLSQEEHVTDPWAETARRKPMKAAGGRLEHAKAEYAKLRSETGNILPELPAP